MNTIWLEPAMVPASLRGNYAGKKFKAVVTEQVTVPLDAGLWSGGSRDHYSAIDFATGNERPFPNQHISPFNETRRDIEVKLIPGFAVVRHSMFCGTDMGLTFYVHPDNAARLLPEAVELTAYEKLVLTATRSFKSSYNGQDRYQIAERDYACKQLLDGLAYPTREQWNTAKASLIIRGCLTKQGGITPKGRNAT